MVNADEMKVLQFLRDHPTVLKEKCGKWFVETVNFHDMCLFFQSIAIPSIALGSLISMGLVARGKITSGIRQPFFYTLTLKGKDFLRKVNDEQTKL